MTTDNDKLQRRIRELEQEVAEWKKRVSRQRYGLVWMEVPESFDEESKNRIPILEEDVKLGFIQNDNQPTHILIEGDNYHSLTCLNYTHRNQVDVIYIDPPYNTGKDGFTYRDSRFLDERPDGEAIKGNHPMRHSIWLSFMAKRLRIAKQLLSDTGVVFISIDDNEQANLKLLCDNIFGEQNFIETYIWNSTLRPDNSSPLLRRNAEFILCYGKCKSKIEKFNSFDSESSGMPSLTKAKEKIKEIYFPANTVKTSLPNGTYYAGCKENGRNPKWELLHNVEVRNGLITTELRLKGHSYWATQKKIVDELALGTEIWIKSEAFVPYYKKAKKSANRPTKILPVEIVGDGLSANTELNGGIFPEKVFNNPKPSTLIGFLINFIDNPNSIVLDFFAGSGTTMHAVSSLNAKDGGRRQCILCQASEADICRSVTLERNRRVMQGYTNAKGEEVKGLGGSLKFYRTAFVGRHTAREASDADRIDLAARAGCLLALAENTLYETERAERFQFFTDHNGRHTAIYFNEDYSDFPAFETHLRSLTGSTAIYVFSWGDGTEFAPMFDDLPNVVVKSIPQPILDIYKSLNT